MTTMAGAHFDGFGEASPLDVNLSPRQVAQVLQRVKDGTFDAFAQAAAHIGHCAHPIRLSGSTTRVDGHTGEVLSVFRSADQPLGVLFQRCGNRRASVCPSCSRLYARDTFEMVRCGVVGGKNVPASVEENPLLFVTLTAPSFGAVHGTRGGKPCHPRRETELCPHGRPRWCMTRHHDGDQELGQPLCPDCYRYDHHLMWQWWAPELWRRFTINLTRALAHALGVKVGKLREVCSVQFAKVAEMQTRGAIHFHALMRLDGPAAQGIGAPAPDKITAQLLADLTRQAVTTVAFPAPAPHERVRPVVLRYGTQLDVKIVRVGHRPDDPDQELQPAQVAGYLSKYATKDASDARHVDGNPHFDRIVTLARIWSGHARARDARRRLGCLVDAPVGKDSLDVYAHLGKWAHELGFRGHFATKSRRYSLTLGTLRRARVRFQHLMAEQQRTGRPVDWSDVDLLADDEDDDTTLVLRDWAYAGTGWDTTADEALALAAAARAREYAQWKAARKNTHPHTLEN
ncbi:replication initiator [Luteococcus sp.]|uniref:replication initiator n=1 Tax=Luteococcus sp. TaxID=1969402 RepID=UPI003736EA78